MLTQSPIPFVLSLQRRGTLVLPLLVLCLLAFSSGCSRFRPERHDTVYVSTQKTYLHDRVAAVSNRVAEVTNGQTLEVLEHGRRFLKVKTQKNEIGWIEERAVIDAKTYDAFAQLGKPHKARTPSWPRRLCATISICICFPAGSGALLSAGGQRQGRAPGPRLAVAPDGLPRTGRASQAPRTTCGRRTKTLPPGSKQARKPPRPPLFPPLPEPPPMEDWWLVRDAQGHAGWLLAGRLDVDVPDEIGTYAEGQRMVGAYVLNKVYDSAASTPDHQVPQYVTVLSPPKNGLPYDFDQVRVFTWSLRHHRYETAFRIHPIQGYLPLKTGSQPTAGGTVPTFSFQIPSGPNLTTDSTTGITRPVSPRTITYMMVDTQVKRTGPDLWPIPVGHLEGEKPKSGKPGKSAKPAKKKAR